MADKFPPETGHDHAQSYPGKTKEDLSEIGWYLQCERVSRNLDLAEAADQCGIDQAQLAALEEGAIEGFSNSSELYECVTLYADHLGFEPEPLLDHYRRALAEGSGINPALETSNEPETSDDMFQPADEPKSGGNVVYLSDYWEKTKQLGKRIKHNPATIKGFMIVLGAIASFYILQLTDPRQGEQIITGSVDNQNPLDPNAKPSRPTKLTKTERERLTALIKRNVDKTVKPVLEKREKAVIGTIYGMDNKRARLVLKARGEVWIRVDDKNGNIVFSRTLKAGDSYFAPNDKEIVLSARDGGVLDYFIDGSPHGPIGNPGEVVVGMELDMAKLSARKKMP